MPQEELDAAQTVLAYKRLSRVERAFRSLKTVDLKVRPIHHRLDTRVRAHVFVCMLAYYVEWHMRQRLAPLLFDDEQAEQAAAARRSPVAPAERSRGSQQKAADKTTSDGLPVHSFQTLLDDLATLTSNEVQLAAQPDSQPFWMQSQPMTLQSRALELLGLGP